ncbi:MAG: nucleotidyltransferase domain-containing protein [Gemmatimonadota bacterium]
MDLTGKRRRYAEALDSALQTLALRLGAMPEVRRVVLFGSAAAGRRDLTTDLDVLVVMDSEDDFVTRTAALYRRLQLGVDLDLLAYTPAEFERMRGRTWMRNALRESRVVYEKDTG